MIIHHQQTLEKLGFETLRQHLAGLASTLEGKSFCERMQPLRNDKFLLAELERVDECKEILEFDEAFTLDYSGSIRAILEHAKIPGNWLSAEDLFEFLKWLKMVRYVVNYFQTRREKYSGLWAMVSKTEFDPKLVREIDRIFTERGGIRDDASPQLKSLRKERNNQSSELRRSLQQTLRKAIQQGWSEGGELTIRNDRLVIPMKADFKGRIRGFVHDVSQSGQTIYLEPSDALDLNNRIRELLLEERNEIIRILSQLTEQVREDLDRFKAFAGTIARLDFVRAKARLAIELKAIKPVIEPDGEILRIVKGYHPLLLLKSGTKREEVIPLSLEIDQELRIILVSGPNAGGKSVTLKTVGMIQLMLQSGLLVPVGEESVFRCFRSIYIDIGDEQSIQTDLSTYTSHLKNMREMLDRLDQSSLFLIDEFGSGTDPRLGGAIAESFLEAFIDSGAYGIITTHYGNLKRLSDEVQGIQNAAMQFDPETLSPTYHLQTGIPGRSYAFEIAQKVGIRKELLKRAKDKLDGNELYSEELLLKLEAQKSELEGLLEENKQTKAQLKGLLERNQQLNRNIESSKNKIIRDAHQQAQGLINSANAKIERTIKEIREHQAEKTFTRSLRKELQEMLPEPPPQEPEIVEEEPEELVGAQVVEEDWVKLKDSQSYGQILEVKGKRAVVALGEMRITVKLKELVKIRKPKGANVSNRSYPVGMAVKRMAHISRELDIQGMRVEQALPIVEKFVDDAILANLEEIRILHGKGTGALRSAIRDDLRRYREVTKMEDAHIEQGGAGWTVVTLQY